MENGEYHWIITAQVLTSIKIRIQWTIELLNEFNNSGSWNCALLCMTCWKTDWPANRNGKIEDSQSPSACGPGKYVGNDGWSNRGVAGFTDADQST